LICCSESSAEERRGGAVEVRAERGGGAEREARVGRVGRAREGGPPARPTCIPRDRHALFQPGELALRRLRFPEAGLFGAVRQLADRVCAQPPLDQLDALRLHRLPLRHEDLDADVLQQLHVVVLAPEPLVCGRVWVRRTSECVREGTVCVCVCVCVCVGGSVQ
jgi:hypothetical protein